VAHSEKPKERILTGFGPRRKQARKRGTETFRKSGNCKVKIIGRKDEERANIF
jgi:hypothetical protein